MASCVTKSSLSTSYNLKSMPLRLTRPDWVRRVNLMAESVGGRPGDMVSLDADELMELATASIGGMPEGDLGDPRWRERFSSLVAAVDASPMHLLGRLMTKQELLRSLRTRLLLTATVDANPGIVTSPVTAPVIIAGPARSGTSILFELLALDPELRAPTAVEVLHPVKPPEADSLPEPLVLSECEQEFWGDVQPEFHSLHELRSDLPVECVTITQGSFCGMHWNMIAQLEGWTFDPVTNYAYERAFLQVLQHGAGTTRWVLKTPAHLMMLPLLFDAFSDAWVVQTHRDPAKTMPSTVSTSTMIQWLRTDEINVDRSARHILDTFAAGLNHSVQLRTSEAVPDGRFVDVHFAELMSDPVGTLRNAYQQMGRDFSDGHAAAVLDYLAEKPKGKFGVHRYTPEDWGYTAEGLRQTTAPYIDHFKVASES